MVRRLSSGRDEILLEEGGNVMNSVTKVHMMKLAGRFEVLELGRLDWSPKKNWVENEGGLPKFIEDIALALIRDHGFTRSRAIATAINRVKKWARGGDNVKADTRAKAIAALAQWSKMKASAKAKRAAK